MYLKCINYVLLFFLIFNTTYLNKKYAIINSNKIILKKFKYFFKFNLFFK